MLEGKFNTKEYFLSNGEQIFIDSRKTVFEKSLTNAKYYNNTLRGFNVLGLGFNAIGIMNFIGMVEKKGVFDGKMIAELVGNIMSLIGGIADVFILEKTSKVLSLHRLNSISMVSAELNIARAGLTKLNSNLWKITFSVLIVNIVVNAFIGYIQFKKNIRNNMVLAVSYGVTAVISIASAVLFFLGAIVWGMALVLLAFVVDFYIKHLESVKIQDYLKNWVVFPKVC